MYFKGTLFPFLTCKYALFLGVWPYYGIAYTSLLTSGVHLHFRGTDDLMEKLNLPILHCMHN